MKVIETKTGDMYFVVPITDTTKLKVFGTYVIQNKNNMESIATTIEKIENGKFTIFNNLGFDDFPIAEYNFFVPL